jgi:hypothetical protein
MNQLDCYNSDTIYNSIYYKYNSNNQLIEKTNNYTIEKYTYEDKKLTEKYESNPKNPEWNRRTKYNYEAGRIKDATIYFNNKISSYLKFEYDNGGNTISRKELSPDSDFLINEYKCSYGQARNPIPFNELYPIDMVQTNNISYSYIYAVTMSSFPPEYNAEFSYNDQGLVIEEKRIYKNYGSKEPQVYSYVYSIEINLHDN